jgi:Ni,Fe-hydrogenase III large subunit
MDELVDTVGGVRRSVLPANQEDMREIRAELRKISRRLDAIEERLPRSKRSS